jgi:Cu(I)/Ag(I) efflux system periplasmic protein CusF
MKTLKTLTLAALTGASFALSLPGIAQAMDHGSHGKTGATAKPTSPADMADGEIKKIDKDNKKLTIKHGEIKNLDMPGMTMVFQVKDAAMIDGVKVGDKIRFAAEKGATGYVVSEIQVSK